MIYVKLQSQRTILLLSVFSSEGTGNADGVCYVWCACVVHESVSYLKTARGSLNDMLS